MKDRVLWHYSQALAQAETFHERPAPKKTCLCEEKTPGWLREVVKSIEHSSVEEDGNHRMREAGGEVTEDGRISWGYRDHMESSKKSNGERQAEAERPKTRNGRCKAGGGNGEGQWRVLATRFWEPGTHTKLLVNSESKEACLCCQVDQGGETLNRECVKGLWLLNKVKSLPSRRNQVPHGRVGSQELSVEGRVTGLSLLMKKEGGAHSPWTGCWKTTPTCESEASTTDKGIRMTQGGNWGQGTL